MFSWIQWKLVNPDLQLTLWARHEIASASRVSPSSLSSSSEKRNKVKEKNGRAKSGGEKHARLPPDFARLANNGTPKSTHIL